MNSASPDKLDERINQTSITTNEGKLDKDLKFTVIEDYLHYIEHKSDSLLNNLKSIWQPSNCVGGSVCNDAV